MTFLFTDVAGSTRLLEELGSEAYAEALGDHRRIVRESLAAHGGIEVDTQGDAFFCVFSSARAAVTCAAAIRDQLSRTPIGVRMGLHTGEALVADSHLVGLDVHHAARIGACGHGGQVVLSPTTAALIEPGSMLLTDLGEHRLKDLSSPLRLYQLGDERFPPLRTLYRTNLPVPVTQFVGRARDLSVLEHAASEPGTRLLTLTGPGGTGKTRLALQLAAELADRFPDGVFWAPLAPLRDPSLVMSAVANALGVEERAGKPLAETVVEAAEGPILLLLDNCEHVLDAVAAVVSSLVARPGHLFVLATSREPLGLTGERVAPVDPLVAEDAVALFDARVQAAGAVLTKSPEERRVIEELCVRLDGLPLAIELAAARVGSVAPKVLLERLSQRLDFLRGPRDADERQRTLRATIAWSHGLLDDREQAVFRRLSVFASAAELEGIEEVCETDLDELGSLVAKSLARITPDGRYWQLETIRQFAAEELEESGEAASTRDRHARWYERRAVDAQRASRSGRHAAGIEEFEADVANLRVAFAHGAGREATSAAELGATLGDLHIVRGRYGEAEETLRIAVSLATGERIRARLERLLGVALVRRGRLDEAWKRLTAAEQALELERPRREGWERELLDVKLAQAHFHYWRGDVDALARAARELEPLVEATGTPVQRADLYHVALQDAFRRERYVLSEETERLARQTFEAGRAVGEWDAHFTLGFALLWRGRLAEAKEQLAAGLADARHVGDVLYEVRCLVYGGIARRKLGDVEGVRAIASELATLGDTYGYGGLVAAQRAWLAFRDGELAGVDRWGDEARAHWEGTSRHGPTVFQWTARFPLLAADVTRGRLAQARTHAAAMLDPSQQPLPDDLVELLRAALAGGDNRFELAVERGRRDGYS